MSGGGGTAGSRRCPRGAGPVNRGGLSRYPSGEAISHEVRHNQKERSRFPALAPPGRDSRHTTTCPDDASTACGHRERRASSSDGPHCCSSPGLPRAAEAERTSRRRTAGPAKLKWGCERPHRLCTRFEVLRFSSREKRHLPLPLAPPATVERLRRGSRRWIVYRGRTSSRESVGQRCSPRMCRNSGWLRQRSAARPWMEIER